LNRRPTYSFILATLTFIVVFSGCIKSANRGIRIPRLNPKYGYKDKEPMGGYVAYHYINSLFNNGVSEVINKSFSKLRYEINYNKSLYIIVAKSVFLSKDDVEGMMNYVGNGNTLFISAEYIDEQLIDTLGARVSFDFSSFFVQNEYEMEKKDTWLSLAHESTSDAGKYGFFFVPFNNRVMSYDTSVTQELGYNEEHDANFIAIDHGQGKFILHIAPAAFSNYFLLTGNNKEYLEKSFSYFKPETSSVYWDNFYRLRKGSDEDFSIAGFFKKHPPLYYAFLIVLGSLLLFIAFGGKRRQRFVPEKNPDTNTTISYTETIGRLYLQKKDNRNIALKMFTYFLENVRNNYYLNTQSLNNEFSEALSRKSGVPEARVKHLLQLMDDTDRADNISDMRLLELHNLIQEYFKK
jgi:predicted nucleic acid-binding protein